MIRRGFHCLFIICSLDLALNFLVGAFCVTTRCSTATTTRRRILSDDDPFPRTSRRVATAHHAAAAATTTAATTTATPGNSFESLLLERLAQNDTSLISIQGYLLSKRSLGKGLVFADFHIAAAAGDDATGDDNNDDQHNKYQQGDECQAMLRQEYLQQDIAPIRQQLLRGAKFRVTGSAAPTRNPGNVVLLIHSVEFLGFPRQLQYIQMLLQQCQEGTIPFDRILSAAGSPLPDSDLYSKLRQLLLPVLSHPAGSSALVVDNKKFLKSLARDVMKALPKDPNYPEAADQVELSKKGNYVLPLAPPEWKDVPPILLPRSKSHHETSGSREKPAAATVLSVAEAALQDTISTTTDASSSYISVMGWVQNRRRFDENITMLALVDDCASLLLQDQSEVNHHQDARQQQQGQGQGQGGQRVLAILHPALVSPLVAGLYRNLAAVGAKVTVQGRLLSVGTNRLSGGSDEEEARTRNNAVLWVDSIRLEMSSSRSITIRHVLDLLQGGELNSDEIMNALLISSEEEADSLLKMDTTQRQWKANELAIRLQDAAAASTGSSKATPTTARSGSRSLLVDPKLLQVLDNYQHLTAKYPINATTLQEMEGLLTLLPESSSETSSTGSTETRQPANGMVREPLPMGMPGTKWQRKKRPQLAWMGQQIREVLEAHPDYGRRRLKILDIGGGKGSLAHYLGQAMQTHVQIHVVDICEGAVTNGANKAERLNLPIDFSLADASQALDVTADVVVALHACGHLSDVALAHAIQRNAGFVIVPCCFNSNPHLQIPIQQDGKEEQVSVSEWLGLPLDDWSALKLLAEVQGDITLANEATAVICAVRAQAACNRTSDQITVSIKRFPIEFSTRNTVLVGRCR